jgi:hypothetical protein
MSARSEKGSRTRVVRLLSCDWDSFFKNELEAGSLDSRKWGLFDWGHREAPFFIDTVWGGRGAAFLRQEGVLPGTTGEEVGFWQRFRFTRACKTYIAESHAFAAMPEVQARVTEVVNFDAHHDGGYVQDGTPTWDRLHQLLVAPTVACDTWTVAPYGRGARVTTVYPRWKAQAFETEPEPAVPMARVIDDGRTYAEPFGRVFVCRSGAWVPPWLDEAFYRFIEGAPKARTDPHLLKGGPLERTWDEAACRAYAAQLDELMARHAKGVQNDDRGDPDR